MFEIIPIDKLVPSADNPRRKVGDVRELAASIAAVGIIEPLVVVVPPGGRLPGRGRAPWSGGGTVWRGSPKFPAW